MAGEPGIDEPPPILGSWRRMYAWVAGLLALDVVLFYWLVRWAT